MGYHYCISDIHGCYDEFIVLLKKIKFSDLDKLYILGDIIDRGPKSLECLRYVMKTANIHLLLGNHEKMMLDYFTDPSSEEGYDWHFNGNKLFVAQLSKLTEAELGKIVAYLRKRPLYKTVNINGKRYFMSHAGLDPNRPFSRQFMDDLVWSRGEFYMNKALPKHTVIFGHTPTPLIRQELGEKKGKDGHSCAVWIDARYNDKICIDSGCFFSGVLSALRLDDGEVFYVKLKKPRGGV